MTHILTTFFSVILNICAQTQCLVTFNPVLPPAGFGVQDTGLNSHGYYPFDVATSSRANWGIIAWSNPPNESYLNAFRLTTNGNIQAYTTDASPTAIQGMHITLTKNLATLVQSQTLAQSGVTTGANCSGSVENDLFIAANAIPPMDSTYPSGYLTGTASPTLDKITSISIKGTVAMVSQGSSTAPSASPCVVNQSAMLYSLVLTNAISGQTLFYQLDLNYFCYKGSNADYNAFCAATVPQENYFETGSGGIWGIDDPITNYSNNVTKSAYSLLQNTTPLDIEINFLPRIAYLITNGKYNLDTNLAHWKWGTFYYGQHTWGSAALTSSWTSVNFSPTITYNSK